MTSAALVPVRVLELRREGGTSLLLSRAAARLMAPFVAWGRVRFFVAETTRPPRHLPCAQIREAEVDEADDIARLGAPAEELRARLVRGDRCLVAIADGVLVAASWWTRVRAAVPELGRDVVLGPREAYCYDARVRADWRRSGVFGALLDETLQRLHDDGARRLWFYTRGDNVEGCRKAASWADAGGSVLYLRRRGGRCRVLALGDGPLPRLERP